MNPLMVFVSDETPFLVATFPQNVIGNIEPGLEAEIAFKARPGQIFKARVRHVVPLIREGELDVGGQVQIATPGTINGEIPVVFEYDREDLPAQQLQAGAIGTIAVYTHRLHPLSLLRKIVLRIGSWENYLFFLPLPSH